MTHVLILMERQEATSSRYRDLITAKFPDFKVDIVGHHSEVDPYIADVDILMCFSPPMADHVVRDAPKLKWIQALGTGVDNIVDLPSLRPDIMVTNIRGIHGAPLSEATLAYMLAWTRDMPRSVHAQDKVTWERWPSRLLNGKTVGILGVGLIAEALAPIFKVLGMTVVGFSSGPRPTAGFDRMEHRDGLVRHAGDLDYLVVLTPMSAETRGIVGASVFKAMKPSAYLINVARGGVVDEPALLAALDNKEIAGAALDVFEQEPLPSSSPFWNRKDVIVMCHMGGFSEGYELRAMPTIEHNIRCYLSATLDKMQNIVRPPV
ncbi:MAG: D-2-hydroxyacid dehydrogenase [Pseudolabrys sp.]